MHEGRFGVGRRDHDGKIVDLPLQTGAAGDPVERFCQGLPHEEADGALGGFEPGPCGPGSWGVGSKAMSDHIYKKIELVGSSTEGTDEAVRNALAKAAETVRNMRWFEVKEVRGHIDDQKVSHWQVTVKIGFTLDE